MYRILNLKAIAFPYILPIGYVMVVDTSSTVARCAILDKYTHLDQGYRLDNETGDWALCPDSLWHRRDDLVSSMARIRKMYREAGLTKVAV